MWLRPVTALLLPVSISNVAFPRDSRCDRGASPSEAQSGHTFRMAISAEQTESWLRMEASSFLRLYRQPSACPTAKHFDLIAYLSRTFAEVHATISLAMNLINLAATDYFTVCEN